MDGSGIPGFEGLDFLVLGLYFAGIVAVVWWSSRRQDTSADYFLASRNIGWFVVGASLFASNIGSEHIVGLSGNGATSGMAMAHWELHAWILIMLGWVFVPFYKRSGVYTMPEFLEKRFNPKARWILSIVSLVAYVFTKVSVTVYAGGMVFSVLLPDTFGTPDNAFWVGALATVILTGIYTVLGGLRAVLYTDTVQTFILIIGSIFITIIGLNALGGWGELQEICRSNAENFSLWRPNSSPDFPWLGILLASPIVGIWYWCTDQYIVQRTLAAKNLRNARRGTIWGGFLKVWPVLIFLLPGLIGYALHQKGIIQIPTKIVDGQTIINGDKVFPTMVGTLLPPGLRGIVVGGLLAALMSSLSSLFNSCASLFTIDIYEKINPQASERRLVTVGRLATGVVVVLGILWIPIMPMISEGGLYKYLQSVQGYLAPPITAVFLLGLFSKRINSAGAVIGLGTGFILGMAKLTIQALVGGNHITEPGWIVAIGEYNFLFASAWLFGISVVIVVIASLLTKKPDPAQISGLTYATTTRKDKMENRASWNRWDIIGTTVVLSLVLGIYLYFSFWLKKDFQPIKHVPFKQVKIQDDFWLPRMETNHRITIPYALKMCEETGRIDNFAIAGGIMKGEHSGKRYNDSDVYKIIEGASYSLALHHDKELETYIDSLIALIAAAQEDDGYLFTTRTIDPEHPAEGSGETRWSMLNSSHELYNVGHMYEAAVAQFQTTGKRTLLDVALKNADLIVSVFGPGKKYDVPGHQEIEIGLTKLFRVTGKEAYLNMAKFFLDQRGLPRERKLYPESSPFAIYNQSRYLQDHKPVLEQKEAVGHAVRASYMYTGMADIAALTRNEDYVKAIDLIWDNVVSKKLYLTGGIGTRHTVEAFGDNYELPNLPAYSETCASVGNAMWNHRLFLLHGHAMYMDVFERILYNGLISGVSMEGDLFFYQNPLESDGTHERSSWFECACCPGNITRFIASVPDYIYAHRGDHLYINLFVSNETSVDMDGRIVKVRQETGYPWDGAVRMTLEPHNNSETFTLHIRIPGWAQNRPVPSDLYRFMNNNDEKITLKVNDKPVPLNTENGYVCLRRLWKKGDVIDLYMPMPVRRVLAHEKVKDDRGKVALQRGPIVFCAEWPDNKGGHVRNILLPDTTQLVTEYRENMLNGVQVIYGRAIGMKYEDDEESLIKTEQDFLAIPYYSWAHRGRGEMAVWFARDR